MLAAAGCGGSSHRSASGPLLDGACQRDAALLQQAGAPTTLGQAAPALRLVIRAERDLAAAAAPALQPRLRGALAGASRVLASIDQADPQQSMTPLRTGLPSSRRAIETARALLREACGAGR